MATQHFFDNKVIKIPGAYSIIKSGIKNPSLDLAFGNTLVIDTGSGANWGGGSGINGTNSNGKDSLYTFDNVRDFQQFVSGGLWWLLGSPLFLPGGGATAGISSLTYVRAAATAPGSITYSWAGGAANGGTFIANPLTEGLAANGIEGDEISAQSTVTVTVAGADTDTIDVTVDGKLVSEYVNTGGTDTVAQVVAALVADTKSKNIVQVIASDATSYTITAPVGLGAYVLTPTVDVTGTAAASADAYAGGVAGTKITRGYGAKMVAGTVDTAKFVIEFYRGSYAGDNISSNIGLDEAADLSGVAEADTAPNLLVKSPEFDNIATLITWATNSSDFAAFFTQGASSASGDGSVDAADLAASAGNELASGGTETFSSTAIDDVLDNVADLNYDFILCDKWGDDAFHADNVKIQGYITTTAKIKPDMFVGGGADSSKWGQALGSIVTAEAFNSQFVSVVHGASRKSYNNAKGYRVYDSIYKAAVVLGREAGLEPQVPIGFKSIGVEGEEHQLTDKEVEVGLDAGVVMARRVGSTFDIVKGINSLQLNDFLVNQDGTTSSKQIRRIARQLNKELVVNVTNNLFKNPAGVNRNTLSDTDVLVFVEGYLKNKVARDTDDDLILSFGDITVVTNGDAYDVTYSIVPNFEVNFAFFTGFLLDPTS